MTILFIHLTTSGIKAQGADHTCEGSNSLIGSFEVQRLT